MFQSAPPRRGRLRCRSLTVLVDGFQSAPPRRGRLAFFACQYKILGLQSAPPRRGRPGQPGHVVPQGMVSIRAPAQGATRRVPQHAQRFRGFNPRPRAGGDGRRGNGQPDRPVVSIRAPAQGATEALLGAPHAPIVSIRAPAQRATGRLGGHRGQGRVSIRAPALGATATSSSGRTISAGFNPRPRAEGDR